MAEYCRQITDSTGSSGELWKEDALWTGSSCRMHLQSASAMPSSPRAVPFRTPGAASVSSSSSEFERFDALMTGREWRSECR